MARPKFLPKKLLVKIRDIDGKIKNLSYNFHGWEVEVSSNPWTVRIPLRRIDSYFRGLEEDYGHMGYKLLEKRIVWTRAW